MKATVLFNDGKTAQILYTPSILERLLGCRAFYNDYDFFGNYTIEINPHNFTKPAMGFKGVYLPGKYKLWWNRQTCVIEYVDILQTTPKKSIKNQNI